MQFERLKLSGFKSFVDQTEFRIERGLTGVVGPNGCGKSNLLEALRWVMGATSAKAMRGDGMDDVIFGGADGRPARGHAEVLLQIDNTDRSAPVQFNAHPVIEVTRRIDRGSGSTYRVNGVETRARDVQLLFADASTGANSPALVRQGQISELIAAKPSNRRRVLEEAAGVSGLHSRRHEAELRLKAAETNLERLSDVASELEAGLGRLKREARQAEKYRRLAAEIRHLQAAVYVARWREADDARIEAARELKTCVALAAENDLAAAAAAAASQAAAERLKPAREEAVVAAAVHQKLLADQGRLDLQQSQAAAELERARGERSRILDDLKRETEVHDDATLNDVRLNDELSTLERAIAAAPQRGPELASALAAAIAARAAADQDVVVRAAEAAAAAARRDAALGRRRDLDARLLAADARVAETSARAARAALNRRTALAEIDTLSPALASKADAEAAVAAAEARLDAARTRLEGLEGERGAASTAEGLARDNERTLDDRLRAARTERDALGGLLGGDPRGLAPVLNDIRAERGFEAALAAALGEDLEASLDPASPRHWAGADVCAPHWPTGARPLTDVVDAPPALAARLAFTALVDASAGERLRKTAPPGARLVSVEGDVWRWDGFTQKAGAPSAAAIRLQQKARLEDLCADVAALEPHHLAAADAHKTARARLRDLDDTLKSARTEPRALEAPLATAQRARDALARKEAQDEARISALRDVVVRADEEAAIIAAAMETAAAERACAAEAAAEVGDAVANPEADEDAVGGARLRAVAARGEETRLRALHDQEDRAATGRLRRREGVQKDLQDWTRRRAQADARIVVLRAGLARAESHLGVATAAPTALEAALQKLLSEVLTAERRRNEAEDALSKAEAAALETDRAQRSQDTALSKAREHRAAAEARAEGAREAETSAADALRRNLGEEPQTVAERLGETAVAIPANAAGVEAHLSNLERDRDAMGPVNLRAEEDASELSERLDAMSSERQDLLGAIARLRAGVHDLNQEGRERLEAAFTVINEHFKALFQTLFEGGQAELRLVESDDPLEAGLEIFACPPGKRLAAMSLMSGGEQALTAAALIFAVFLANPSPVCVLDEVDAPLDDANVDRFCRLLDEMRRRTETRFIVITHNPVTMSRVDRLFGVTMPERGISQLVSINLRQAEALAAE